MLEPGTVKAGGELVYQTDRRGRNRTIVKVDEVISERGITLNPGDEGYASGIIVLEGQNRFLSDGTPAVIAMHYAELFPLTPELRREIEGVVD